MKKRLAALTLAGTLLLSACGGEIASEGGSPPLPALPGTSAQPSSEPEKGGYEWLDPTGVYHGANDERSILTVLPTEGGTDYLVHLDLTRLAQIEGKGSYDEAGIFSFTGQTKDGFPVTAVITRDGNNVLLTVTQSDWGQLPLGSIYSFLRNLPQVTAEMFRELLADYVGAYAKADRSADTSAAEAKAALALVQFAVDNHLYYRNQDEIHTAAHEGYMSLTNQQMNRFDFNVFNGLYQLVEDAFKDYDMVRDHFRTAGLEKEMEELIDTADSYGNWGALRNHLFTIGSATMP